MKDEKSKHESTKAIITKVLKESKAEMHELIFREGKALDPVAKIKRVDVKIAGTITAPSELFLKRPDQFDKKRAHILYSKNPEKLSIVLKTNEHMERPHYDITGKLDLSDEMKIFGIAYRAGQEPASYTTQDLAKLLRFNKRLFVNAGDAKIMIEGLSKFRIKVSQEAALIKEKNGSMTENFAQTVKHECPMEFTLAMPIYKGKPPRKFKIEIYSDVKSANDITLWLESPDLAELVQTDANTYIDEELKKMETLVQIEQ